MQTKMKPGKNLPFTPISLSIPYLVPTCRARRRAVARMKGISGETSWDHKNCLIVITAPLLCDNFFMSYCSVVRKKNIDKILARRSIFLSEDHDRSAR